MSKTLKVVSSIAIISLIAKIFGAGRELTLSYCFGSSSLSDAYILATTIPVTIFSFIYESIAAGFIPACSMVLGAKSQSLFTSKVLNTVMVITLVIVLVIEAFPDFVIRLFASGFNDETMQLSSLILRISILGVFFTAISNILVAYLNYNNSFLVATARAIPLDITVIISIILGYYYDSIIILAVGIPISIAISTLFLLPETKRVGFHYTPSFDFKDENVKNLLSWSLPVILSTALIDINTIVDRQFASYLRVGGISIITYSTRLITIFTSLLIVPVLTFLFPNFTKTIQEGKNEEANKLYKSVLKHLLMITIPAVFFIMVMSPEIVDIVFKRGAFGDEDAALTSNCLLFYCLTILAFAVSSLATRFFYADTDMWTPLKISCLGVCTNILGDFILSHFFGLQGLAIASSFSLLLAALLQHIILTKKRSIERDGLIKYVSSIFLASILGSLVLVFKSQLIKIAGLYVGSLALFIIYTIILVIALKVFKIKEIDKIIKLVKK